MSELNKKLQEFKKDVETLSAVREAYIENNKLITVWLGRPQDYSEEFRKWNEKYHKEIIKREDDDGIIKIVFKINK